MKYDSIKLWVDDVRDPLNYGLVGWTWVKTVEEAITLLKTGRVTQASLDHDLDQAYPRTLDWKEVPSGYDLVVWIDRHGFWPPDGVMVHSVNHWGRAAMEDIVWQHYKNERRGDAKWQNARTTL